MKDRIDSVLVRKGYFETRQKAKYAIENDCIYVDDKLVQKPSKMIDEEASIEVKGDVLPFVSRGGLKLAKAISSFDIKLKDKVCMDIGASTGGFTDCMLQKGASKVYAVDVGHDQLSESLKKDNRVINLEGTNIRQIETEEFGKLEFISIDVSFISLTQVIDKAYELLKDSGEMVTLIKPQFEAGKEYINKNGVVKDKKIHEKVIEKIILFANSLQFEILALDYSPIKGPAGNIEYLLYLKKKNEKESLEIFSKREQIKQIVEKAHKELKNKE